MSIDEMHQPGQAQPGADQGASEPDDMTGPEEETGGAPKAENAVARTAQKQSLMRRIDKVKVRIGTGAQSLQKAALPAASRTGALVKRRTSEAAVRLRRFNTQRARPSAARFLGEVRERLRPASIKRDYRSVLEWVHISLLGRSQEALFFAPTKEHARQLTLNIPSQLRGSAHDYRPTPFKLFEWAASSFPEDLEDRVFVDVGAGRGRTLLLASQFPFERVVGVEIARELHEDCEMNIAQYPRSLMKCRDVTCLHARAATMPIPNQPTIFYLFDPFDEAMFKKLLARIARSYKRARREIHLICVDMAEVAAVETEGVFRPVPLPARTRMMIKLFSPYSIRVYKTDP